MAIIQGTKVEITVGGQTFGVDELTAPTESIEPIPYSVSFTCTVTPAPNSFEALMVEFAHLMNRKKFDIKPRWRRVSPGKWAKWSGWYARDTRTGEVSPVLCMVERQPLKGVCGRDRNLYAATLEWHGGKIYGRTHWDWKVARESTEDRDFGAWNWFEFYREGEGNVCLDS